MKIEIKVIGGYLPEWGNLDDAGLDLRASEDMVLKAAHEFRTEYNHYDEKYVSIPIMHNVVVPLGIQTSFDANIVAIVKDRSSLAAAGVYTSAGVIDSGYRGEWKILMRNCSANDFVISRGDKIAQVLFLPVFHLVVDEVESLRDSSRGASGFGSTGK